MGIALNRSIAGSGFSVRTCHSGFDVCNRWRRSQAADASASQIDSCDMLADIKFLFFLNVSGTDWFSQS
jgi:hypothetical protein